MAEAAAAAAAARAAPVHEEDDADECPVLVEVQDTPAAAPPLEGTRPKVPVSCWWWQHTSASRWTFRPRTSHCVHASDHPPCLPAGVTLCQHRRWDLTCTSIHVARTTTLPFIYEFMHTWPCGYSCRCCCCRMLTCACCRVRACVCARCVCAQLSAACR
jgi:hypothetical protein